MITRLHQPRQLTKSRDHGSPRGGAGAGLGGGGGGGGGVPPQLPRMGGSASAASSLESYRKPPIRSASSSSPIAAAAAPSALSDRRNPRFGSCSQGIGPCPCQPARLSWSRPR